MAKRNGEIIECDSHTVKHAKSDEAVNGYGQKDNLTLRHQLIGGATSIHYKENPVKIATAKGQYMFDETGKRFLDCINNVTHVGHCHPHVVAACHKQMEVLNTNSRFLYDQLPSLALKLISKLPPKLTKCYFVCTGTEANDLALRLAQIHTKRKDALVLDRAYHGHSVAVHQLSPYKFDLPGGGGRKKHIHVAPCPDGYRGIHRGNNDEHLGEKYFNELKKVYLNAKGEGREVAAFFAESMQSCAGQIIPPPGFLKTSYEFLRSEGVVCIADEVQVGFGRVGKHFWAFELSGVEPDIVTIGKPMGNGHPVAAVITTDEISKAFGDNGVPYFNTYGGNPVSCAVATAVLEVIENEKLQEKALQLGQYWLDELHKLQEKHHLIGDIRGAGLFIGIELVTDRETKAPATKQATEISYRMRSRGILITVDGTFENVLKIKPPMVIEKQDVEFFNKNLDQVMTEVEQE